MVYDLFCLFFGTFFSDSGGDMPTVPPSFENGLIVLIVRLFLCLFLFWSDSRWRNCSTSLPLVGRSFPSFFGDGDRRAIGKKSADNHQSGLVVPFFRVALWRSRRKQSYIFECCARVCLTSARWNEVKRRRPSETRPTDWLPFIHNSIASNGKFSGGERRRRRSFWAAAKEKRTGNLLPTRPHCV